MLTPTEQGYWVDERHARIAELVKEYNPNLDLVWIPPENRIKNSNEAPYAVRHTTPDGKSYIVFHIQQGELDHRVLAKIYAGDTTKHDVLEELEMEEKAKEIIRLKELEDAAADRRDFIKTVAASPLHRFRHNGKIIPK
jgi:hypothetical protein